MQRELDLCLQNVPGFSQRASFQYRFMNTIHSAARVLNAHFTEILYHNRISETKVLGLSPLFGKDPDDEVATEHLTAVDV